MSRERRPGLGGITGGAIGRSTGSLGAPGKRTLTQGLVQRKARAVWTGEPATAHDESRAPLGREGGEAAAQAHTGATVGHSPATIDAPAAWDESLGRPTIAIASGAVGEGAAGEVAASGAAEPGWVQRARAYHEAHAAAVAEFDRLTGGACAGDDGGLDPRKVARWQAEHGAAPDGRVGEATLDAARAAGRGAGAGGDRAATSEPMSIDAPARYDEVDRGTLQEGEPGAAAPAGGDRAATSEPVSIDAPARYDEVDRGTLALGGAVQRRVVRAGASAEGEVDPVAVAAAGVEGASQPLPHLDAIQASFGPHDVSGVRAQVGGAAAEASDALGAEAYATGDRVGFAASPSLHTAAHEAAHVVQQRAGVQLKGGVGQAGDAYEQHADAVADAVAAGRSAEALFGDTPGRNDASSGSALQFVPMPSGGATVARDARDAIDAHEPAAMKREKEDLLAAIKDATSGMFDLLGYGVDKATDGLKIVDAKPQRLASVAALLELAATAAVGGGAGMVGTLIVGRAWADVRERTVVDTIKDGIKTAILKGAGKATPVASEAILLLEFADIQKFKIHEAKMQFQQEFWASTIERLRTMGLAEIKKMSAAAITSATDKSLVVVQEQRTVVEWVNYLARQHHGAMEWEPRMPGSPQQGEDGNAFSFVKTDAVNPANEGSDPFASNVDPGGVLHLMDDEQRKMQEAHHGLLEVHVWHPRGGALELYTGDSKAGMRLDNVTDYVRSTLRKLGTVGAARVNKLIRLYVDRGQADINPRKPEGAILVTADGYIRRVDHLTLEADELARIVNGVNEMSLEALT